MNTQLTRNNHYVPVWYQKGFFALGESQLHYLDMQPDSRVLPNGRIVPRRDISRMPPQRCFCTLDLYTTQFGSTLNDEIERYLFGAIDNNGAKAVRAFLGGDLSAMHESFQAFFEYLDAQKLRTPKGLDWIKSRYPELSQLDLMLQMQGLRRMHCTMWTEAVREIVSAEASDVKFIVSDHPVTIYNAAFPPESASSTYPSDPSIELIGSQTVFVLDPNTCLVLTHLEYAENPDTVTLTAPRANARFAGSSLVRTDALIRERKLSSDEVTAVNYCLKSRARRYVAAANKEWLYPERSYTGGWAEIAQILLPRDDLWQFGGEIYVGYKDGSTHYQDAYGRTSGAHEYLRKKHRSAELQPNDLCGCGSGIEFNRCCEPLPQQDRPSWDVYGIRERNLMFCRAVEDILGLRSGKTWDDVRRELNDDQIKRIHEAFGSLWPVDTDLTELLPRPNATTLRATYQGAPDARTVVVTIAEGLTCFDELIIPHPFMNPAHIKPEYSPISSPSQYKDQTLRDVLSLLMLEPYIDAGYVHLIPDPSDFNSEFGRTVMKMAEDRTRGWAPEIDSKQRERFMRLRSDDYNRFLARLPENVQRSMIQRSVPEVDKTSLDAVIARLKVELEEDPYALLQPIPPGKKEGQVNGIKGYCLETTMYLAALTGAVVYTDFKAHWQQLHIHTSAVDPARVAADWQAIVDTAGAIVVPIEFDWASTFEARANGKFGALRAVMRRIVRAIQDGSGANEVAELASQFTKAAEVVASASTATPSTTRLNGRIEISIPQGGFECNDVRRLLLTFGRAKTIHPIQFALYYCDLDRA